jgi:subtilisin-like proprotein convertase family protein
VFDDAAARPLSSAVPGENGDDPFTGSWKPASPLSALAGHSADGAWTFHVADQAAADVGSVRAFSLHLSGFVG